MDKLQGVIAGILYGDLTYKNYLDIPRVRIEADKKITQIIEVIRADERARSFKRAEELLRKLGWELAADDMCIYNFKQDDVPNGGDEIDEAEEELVVRLEDLIV